MRFSVENGNIGKLLCGFTFLINRVHEVPHTHPSAGQLSRFRKFVRIDRAQLCKPEANYRIFTLGNARTLIRIFGGYAQEYVRRKTE